MTVTRRPMLFVVGASRSGTTLVTQMLGKHSRIAGLREMQFFGEFCDPRAGDEPLAPAARKDAIAALFRRQEDGILAARHRRSADPAVATLSESLPEGSGALETFAATVAFLADRQGKSIPCEQTPRNIYYARELLEAYPESRVVHVLRDPRGVMASQKLRWRRRGLIQNPAVMSRAQQLRTWFNYHPYTVAQLWNLATRRALALEGHPRFHLLRFEDLVEDPQQQLRELCEFIGVDFEPAMLDIEHVNSSYVATAGAERGLSRAPIDAWRGKLSASECAVTQRRCGALMQRVGYQLEPARMNVLAPLALTARYPIHLAGAVALNPRRLLIQMRGVAFGNGGARRSGSPEQGPSSPEVFGLPCVDEPLEQAARELVDAAQRQIRRRVLFVNAHCVNVSMGDPRLRRALAEADVLYADGVGMALAARLQGRRLAHNVNGTDLFPHLCRQAQAAGVSLALLGAEPGVAEACAEVLHERYPGLRVVWTHHGFVGDADDARLIADINACGAGILLVAMGVPRQEQWIMEHAGRLRVPVIMGVGGLFDFVSGNKPRAPAGLRRLRLEWLFRLALEPRRMFGRYVIGNPAFLARAIRYAATGRAGPAPRQGTAPR